MANHPSISPSGIAAPQRSERVVISTLTQPELRLPITKVLGYDPDRSAFWVALAVDQDEDEGTPEIKALVKDTGAWNARVGADRGTVWTAIDPNAPLEAKR
jgi:hypothetical protein